MADITASLESLSRKEVVMVRLYSLSSWFCTCVAIVLAILVPLVVPEDVFANAGNDCYSVCSETCGTDSSCMSSCMSSCCQSMCMGSSDPNCVADCTNFIPVPCPYADPANGCYDGICIVGTCITRVLAARVDDSHW